MTIIPHSMPTLEKDDVDAVSSVLKSGLIAQGDVVESFENTFAHYHGKKGGVAVNSGTAALHLSLLALGIGKNHKVIIPSYSCIALYNAVKYTGAEPILADTLKDNWDMDPAFIEDYLKKDSRVRKTKAIVVVHLFGSAVNMDDYMYLSKRHEIPIIEDCAQSVGAEYKNRKVGTFGKVSIFSFYATKVMTTGEGGMVVSDLQKILNKVRELREYDEKIDNALRFNYKMTDFQAAMGMTQLKKLASFIRKRFKIAKKYMADLKDAPVVLPQKSNYGKDIYYRFVIRMNNPKRFIDEMGEKGIICRKPVFMPIHRIIKSKILPNAERIWKEAVSLPIYPLLTEGDVNKIISSAKRVLYDMIYMKDWK